MHRNGLLGAFNCARQFSAHLPPSATTNNEALRRPEIALAPHRLILVVVARGCSIEMPIVARSQSKYVLRRACWNPGKCRVLL